MIIDYVDYWMVKTEIPLKYYIKWLKISPSKFYDWKKRYGKVNEHNALIPRDHWLEVWEKVAILEYYELHPLEGYRRLTYMMMDADIVAASPSSVYRVLKNAGVLGNRKKKESKKGKGFKQPEAAHKDWHIDVTYINICGTFYYLCGILDGYSRYIVHWEIRDQMKEADIEIIVQRAREKYPDAKPKIISDNGPQFIAKDFKEFIRICGMRHVKTSPYYPQSNGKIERWHQSLKKECIRPKTPVSLNDSRDIVYEYVNHYNDIRLHSAIGYIAPKDKIEGREKQIFEDRDRKLQVAREKRKERRRLKNNE